MPKQDYSDTTALLERFNNTQQELLHTLAAFEQEQLNAVPAAGGWSAAQVADHLIKGEMTKVLHGPVKPAGRPSDKHVPMLEAIFLDFNTKMESPHFILPAETPFQKEEILSSLQHIGTATAAAIQTLNLSPICLSSPQPLGELTRLELIWFIIFHTQRHTHQIKNILKQLILSKENISGQSAA